MIDCLEPKMDAIMVSLSNHDRVRQLRSDHPELVGG